MIFSPPTITQSWVLLRVKRIEIFVEGISELIFVRDILQKIYNYDATIVYIHCNSLNTSTNSANLWTFGNINAKYHIEITDTGSYTKLLSAITDRRKRLSENKASLVLGLRDIDSQEYEEYKKDHNRGEAIQKVEKGTLKGLGLVTFDMEVKIFYAVTQLEAWFLALHKIFPQIDSRLTHNFIKTSLGLDLENIDPEKDLEKPSNNLVAILALINNHDDKPRRTNVVISKITLGLIEEIKNQKVSRMHKFIKQLKTLV